MRPLEQQTILVTGSTDGLGREVARELAGRGAELLVHGRDRARCEETVRAVCGATGSERVESHLADLSSLAEVRRLADEVKSSHERLDALVNNAGVAGGRGGRRHESADGHELTFAVNYLSHFLLTLLLLPLLRASAPARIVNVSSIGQRRIDFDDLMMERRYDAFDAYAQSKLAQIMFTFELAERLGTDSGVTVNALHPATLMDTKMVRESFGRAMTGVEQGTQATLRLIADPELDGVSGRYFDGLKESRPHRQAYDPQARRRLWELSEVIALRDERAREGRFSV